MHSGMLYRDWRLLMRSLSSLLVLLLLTAAGCFGVVYALSDVENAASPSITVAVCNLDKDSRLGSAILSAGSRNDMVKRVLDVTLCDTEEEARAFVEDGGTAAVIIPENFFENASHGHSLPCRILLNSAGQGSSHTLSRYLSVGTQVLTGAQQIVFAGDQYMLEKDAPQSEADSFNLYMNLYALGTLENMEELAVVRVTLPYSHSGLGVVSYYTVLYLVFALSFLILAFYRLYRQDMTRGSLTRLTSSGIREGSFFLWKWLLPFFFEAGLLVLFMSVSALFFKDSLTLAVTPASLLSSCLAVLFLTGLGMMLTCAISRSSGVVWFLLQTAGLFFCGGIIPYSHLSPVVLMIGRLTPLGVSAELMSPLLGGVCSKAAPFLAAAYLAAACLVCHRSYQRTLVGREVLA